MALGVPQVLVTGRPHIEEEGLDKAQPAIPYSNLEFLGT